MSEWKRPAQPIRCVVELDKPLTVRRERWLLAQGDANANAIVAEVYQTAGKPYDLTGCTVMLTFVRPDNLALPPIEAEISGNTAIATLKDACYEVSGVYVATVQLRKEGAERTILWLIGDVKGKDIDGIVDPDREVISIEDLMATASEAQKAASEANAAANRANAGADRVEQMQIDASGLAGDSNKLGGKAPEYYIPALNLLNNPDFAIAQAGYNEYHGNTLYHADRWHGNGIGTLSVSGAVKTFTSVSGFATMTQNLWNDGRDHGKAYTLVVTLPDGSRIACSGTSPDSPTTTETVFADVYAPDKRCWFLVLKNANNTMSVRVDASQAGSSVSFLHMDLFEGVYTADNAPVHATRPYADELAECRRYYRELKYLVARPYHVASSARYYRIALEPPMRENVNPSVNIVGPIETPLNSWTDTGATFAVSAPAPTNFTVSATGDASETDFILRIDANVSSDL